MARFTYRYSPGEPIGRPLVYPFIRCLATAESQTGNTYDVIHFNLARGPLGEDLPGDAAGSTRVLLPEQDRPVGCLIVARHIRRLTPASPGWAERRREHGGKLRVFT